METIDNIADSISFAEQGRSAEEVNEVINAKLDIVDEHHKAGFVNIVGNPNVGKSTLMNDLVGERISIITSKAQTTRHRIMGIVNTPDYQIVYSDTPGVLKPKYKLQESMLDFSQGALTDADVLLYVTDVVEDPTKNLDFLNRVAKEKVPVILIINKIDLPAADPDRVKHEIEDVIGLPAMDAPCISAKNGINIEDVLEAVIDGVPAPKGDETAPLKALIFDSYYDSYKGVIVYVRIKEGTVKKGDRIKMMATGAQADVVEVGYFGAGLEYAFDTIFGPFKANVHWSNMTNKVGFYISAGYNF